MFHILKNFEIKITPLNVVVHYWGFLSQNKYLKVKIFSSAWHDAICCALRSLEIIIACQARGGGAHRLVAVD